MWGWVLLLYPFILWVYFLEFFRVSGECVCVRRRRKNVVVFFFFFYLPSIFFFLVVWILKRWDDEPWASVYCIIQEKKKYTYIYVSRLHSPFSLHLLIDVLKLKMSSVLGSWDKMEYIITIWRFPFFPLSSPLHILTSVKADTWWSLSMPILLLLFLSVESKADEWIVLWEDIWFSSMYHNIRVYNI